MKRQTFVEYFNVIIVSLCVFAFTAFFSFVHFSIVGNVNEETSKGEIAVDNKIVIIDAGHGGEDGGAVGIGGSLEKDINLDISRQLSDLLCIINVDAVMTRNGDNLLYKPDQENRKKFYDLHNRVELAKEYDNAVFVSIHQNKFPVEKYHGLQVYYSGNHLESAKLANLIQNNTKTFLQYDNNRETKKAGRNIYLLKNLECPAVLVECGFISNTEEERNLTDREYTRKLSFILMKSIVEYLY